MKKIISILLAAVMLLSCLSVVACKSDDIVLVGDHVSVFGITATVVFYGQPSMQRNADAAFKQAEENLVELDNQLSTSIPTSDISKFNAAPRGIEHKVYLRNYSQHIFEQGLEIYQKTNGAFNPAIFNLVDFWGFAPVTEIGNLADEIDWEQQGNEDPRMPGNEKIDALLEQLIAQCDFKYVLHGTDEQGFYIYKDPSSPVVVVNGVEYTVRIDFGSIGKGFGADLVIEAAKDHGIKKGFANLAGNVYVLQSAYTKESPGDTFQVLINHPRDGFGMGLFNYATTHQKDVSIVTSGDYEKCYFDADNVRMNHIIDPTNGLPVNTGFVKHEDEYYFHEKPKGIISATIIGESSMLCDAYATAVIVIANQGTVEDAIRFLEENNLTAIICYQDLTGSTPVYKARCIGIDKSQVVLRDFNAEGMQIIPTVTFDD